MLNYSKVKSMIKTGINPFNRLDASSTAVKLLLLFCALTAFSSPMPQNISWLELLMGIGIFSSFVIFAKPVLVKASESGLYKLYIAIITILLVVPSIGAFALHNSWMNVARDFLPVAFFLIVPICIFVHTSSNENSNVCNLLAITLVFIGVSETFAFYLGLYDLIGNPVNIMYKITNGIRVVDTVPSLAAANIAGATSDYSQEGIQYKIKMADAFIRMYDPAVFFASIAMSCTGLKFIFRSWRTWFFGVLLLVFGIGIAFGFLLLGLRANVLLYLVAVTIYAGYYIKTPGFYLRLLPVVVFLAIVMAPWVVDGISLLFLKQYTMGTNGKASEWLAVINQISTSVNGILFGLGWGGTFHNPILNYSTRFTHSMISFFILKTGIVGLVALFLYFFISIKVGSNAHQNSPDLRRVYILSTIPPLLVGILFQPSYKILTFALIFTLFVTALPFKMRESKFAYQNTKSKFD